LPRSKRTQEVNQVDEGLLHENGKKFSRRRSEGDEEAGEQLPRVTLFESGRQERSSVDLLEGDNEGQKVRPQLTGIRPGKETTSKRQFETNRQKEDNHNQGRPFESDSIRYENPRSSAQKARGPVDYERILWRAARNYRQTDHYDYSLFGLDAHLDRAVAQHQRQAMEYNRGEWRREYRLTPRIAC